MSELPQELTRVVEALDGAVLVSHGTENHFPVYRSYWCERCKRYRLWPGPDWGASHYFCDECLTLFELQGE